MIGCFMADCSYNRHIGVVDNAVKPIRQQTLGESAEERIGVVQQRRAEPIRAAKLRTVE